MLAQKFGVALPEQSEGSGDDATRRDAALREALLKVHEIAAAYFRSSWRDRPVPARGSSWRSASVPQATIEQLGLGFAPQSREG